MSLAFVLLHVLLTRPFDTSWLLYRLLKHRVTWNLFLSLVNIHSMTRANLNKSEWLVTNTTAASNYIPKRPRICINWNPPFRPHFIKFSNPVSYISYEVNLASQCSHLEVLYYANLGLKGGISIYADSGSLMYVLWCCGSICHQPFTFIQIGFGHTVHQSNCFSRFSTSICIGESMPGSGLVTTINTVCPRVKWRIS